MIAYGVGSLLNQELGVRRCVSLSGWAAVLVLGLLAPFATSAHADVPQPPPSLTTIDNSAAGFTLSWQPSPSTDLTGYQVQWSQDGAETWQDVSGGFTTSTQYPVSAPPAGHTIQYRVVAQNADGDSEATSDIDTYTPGNVAQTFIVRMADGTPVTQGSLEWSDGDGTWNSGYTLNSRGEVTLPSVPAGISENLQITDGHIGGNETVEKDFSLDFGTTPQTLVVPPPPPMIVDKVTVTMPGGIPAVGVEVDADYYQALDDFVDTADGFTYADFNALEYDDTDANGAATVKGWSAENVDFVPASQYPYPEQAVDLLYNDGVLRSESVGLLTGTDTALQIDPLPYTTTTDPSTVPVGDTATARFRVHAAPSGNSTTAKSAAKSLAGVHVTLVPPKGWSAGACSKKSVLTGVSNSTGHVQLPVCAAQVTRFKVRTQGALPTAPITITTRKSAPGAPATVRASSPGRGQLRVVWTKAVYSGGAHITAYRVTATSKGHRTVRWTSSARGHKHTFDRLAHSTVWTVTVCPVNARGPGETKTTRARVR